MVESHLKRVTKPLLMSRTQANHVTHRYSRVKRKAWAYSITLDPFKQKTLVYARVREQTNHISYVLMKHIHEKGKKMN